MYENSGKVNSTENAFCCQWCAELTSGCAGTKLLPQPDDAVGTAFRNVTLQFCSVNVVVNPYLFVYFAGGGGGQIRFLDPPALWGLRSVCLVTTTPA